MCEFEIKATSDAEATDKTTQIVNQYQLPYWELVRVETTLIAGCELAMME